MVINLIVVLYNRDVRDCRAVLAAKAVTEHDVRIYVADNGTNKFNNRAICSNLDCIYLNMDGNRGLSCAYNRLLDCMQPCDFVVFSDDDTELTNDYFDTLALVAKAWPNKTIFAPYVQGQDGVLYSPNRSNIFKNKLISSPDDVIEDSEFNAIMSCTAARWEVMCNYRFDEALFVDVIDQNFYDEQRELDRSFATIPVLIRQQFSQRDEKIDPVYGLHRVQCRVADLITYYGKFDSVLVDMGGGVKCFLLGMQMAYKCQAPSIVAKTVMRILKSFRNRPVMRYVACGCTNEPGTES